MPKFGAKPILITVTGGVFMYSGIKGLTISQTLRDLVSGKNPTEDAPMGGSSGGSSGGGQIGSPPSTIVHQGGDTHGKVQRIGIGAIYRYARQAGFAPAQAVIATAVAMAESTGNIYAHCLNCVPGVTEDSRGLWQINVDAHPWATSGDLYDPAVNAAAAYQIANGGRNFTPWSTYTNGAYKQFLPAALRAAGRG